MTTLLDRSPVTDSGELDCEVVDAIIEQQRIDHDAGRCDAACVWCDGGRPKPSQFLLTFGKYAGKPLAEVPRNYLEWLVQQPGKFGSFKEAQVAAGAFLQSQPKEPKRQRTKKLSKREKRLRKEMKQNRRFHERNCR